jgi:hypothetical protein
MTNCGFLVVTGGHGGVENKLGAHAPGSLWHRHVRFCRFRFQFQKQLGLGFDKTSHLCFHFLNKRTLSK